MPGTKNAVRFNPLILSFYRVCLLTMAVSQGQAQSAQEDTWPTYQVDMNTRKVDLFDLIDRVELIRLEETEASLLGEVRYYTATQNGFIIPDQRSKEILFFSEDGTYQHKISKWGQGPEEYNGFANAWIKDSLVEFYDGARQNLHRYTLTGELEEIISPAIDKGWRTGNMHPTPEGYIINMLDPGINDKTTLMAIFLDQELKLNQKVNRQSPPIAFPVNLGKRYSHDGTALYYRPVMSDKIYRIENQQPKPFAQLQLGEDWLWSDPMIASELSLASDLVINDESHIFEVIPNIGEQYISLTLYYTIKKTARGLIDRATGKFYQLKLRKQDKSDFKMSFLLWEKDLLVTSLPSYDLEEFLNQLDKEQWSIRGGHSLESLLNSENPVIMKLRFKPGLGR